MGEMGQAKPWKRPPGTVKPEMHKAAEAVLGKLAMIM
jgi:hypothetical protein